jgi:hypothetical protein
MVIGPANPVLTQFRMTTWSPGTADSSAQTEPFKRNSWSDGTKVESVVAKAGTPPDTDRPTHKLRTALGLSTIPPVTVELPEASSTRPSSTADNTPNYTKDGIARRTSPGLPVGGDGGLMSSRIAPPNGSNSRSSFGLQAPATLPDTPGALSAGRPTLPPLEAQQLKQTLIEALPRELPESGALSQGRPAPPQYSGLTALGLQSTAAFSPPNTSPLPPLPLASPPKESTFEDGTPRTADDQSDVSGTRARIKRALAQRSAVIEGNQIRRAEATQERVAQLQARVARESAAPPANGAETTLTTKHHEPPFDPAARADINVGPRQSRGRVARKDSVLYDQVGASIRVEASSQRASKAINQQRDIGRREFEMRQRRNSAAVQQSEVRNNVRQLAEMERLEASELEDVTARAEARHVAIQRDFFDQQQLRKQTRTVINQGSSSRQATLQSLVTSAQQQRDRSFKANVNTRATAVTERQREVFDLQLQYAEQRRFVRVNPLETVGNEAVENLNVSRTGEEKFKAFRADKGVTLGRVEEQRSEKVSAKRNDTKVQQTQATDQAKERTLNVRRRLASTYRAQSGGDTQSRGSL